MNLGQAGEDLTAKYYQNLGFKILERNFKFAHGKQMGELDLVVRKGNEIVFVEVKTRSNQKFGTSFEAIDFFKQEKLVRMAKSYINYKKLQGCDYRIDVAAVDIDKADNPVIILTNAIEDLD